MTELLTTGDYLDTPQDEDPFLFTPEAARKRIESLGFTPDYIDILLGVGAQGSSHELYALAVIASQNDTISINDLYHELYPGEKQAETFADVKARQAADEAEANGLWERFTHRL